MADTREAVDQLRSLVEDEKELYVGSPPDERILLQFLRCVEFNVDKAFERIRQVYKLKSKHPEFHAYRRDPMLHDVIIQKAVHLMLDKRDQRGRRIYLLKLGNLVYGAHEPHEMFQVDDLWITLALDEEETQKNGLVMLFDMDRFPWKFLRYFTPHIVGVSTAKAESIPVRNIQYHVVNGGIVMNTVVQLVYPFLSQATKDVIHIHKNLESLHAHISPSVLPREYGGEKPLDPPGLVRDILDARNQRLAELLSYGYSKKLKENE